MAALYDVEANTHMWMSDLIPIGEESLPLYLTSEDMRRGMKAIQMIERGKEELVRLQQEHKVIRLWLDHQLTRSQAAIAQCHGMFIMTFCFDFDFL